MQTIKPYLRTTAIAFSIWVVAILINTVFVMFWMGFSKPGGFDLGIAGFIIYFSAMFSSPGFFILWLTFMLQMKNKNLFNILLITAFIGSLLSSVILVVFLSGELKKDIIMLFISPVAMALLSVLMHKPFIKKIIEKYNYEPCIETL